MLWEINTKKLPFEDSNLFNNELEQEICFNNLRPKIEEKENWNEEYLLLIESCWSDNPDLRPDAKSIAEELSKLHVSGSKLDVNRFSRSSGTQDDIDPLFPNVDFNDFGFFVSTRNTLRESKVKDTKRKTTADNILSFSNLRGEYYRKKSAN